MGRGSKSYEAKLLSAALAIAVQIPLSHGAAAHNQGVTGPTTIEGVEFLTT
jgi:hypothetical protein